MIVSAAPLRGVKTTLHNLIPPVREFRFWIVQIGVLSVAILHDVVLVEMPEYHHHSFGVDDAMTSALLVIPVIYAALNFGFRGSVATALWATVLIAPHWFLMHPLTEHHLVVEIGNLLVVNAVAVIVGERVEREGRARSEAEAALRAARVAEMRYHSLFEDQPAPVLITDAAGTVNELNSAAVWLLGREAAGRDVKELLGAGLTQLLGGIPCCLELRAPEGDALRYAPFARRLVTDEGRELVQIVLTDITEQHRRQEEQRLFSTRLLQVQEEERRRLARELHDDPLQDLTYLARRLEHLSQHPELPLEVVDGLAGVGIVAADAAAALRKLIRGLRPPVLDDFGLVAALRQLTGELRQRSELAIDLIVSGDEHRLPPDVELAAYRIAQESLNNVLRHADAKRATVRLRYGAQLTLTVSDNGCGLEPHPRASAAKGLGLLGMRERVNMLGGTLEVRSRSPRGTAVMATLPVAEEPLAHEITPDRPLIGRRPKSQLDCAVRQP